MDWIDALGEESHRQREAQQLLRASRLEKNRIVLANLPTLWSVVCARVQEQAAKLQKTCASHTELNVEFVPMQVPTAPAGCGPQYLPSDAVHAFRLFRTMLPSRILQAAVGNDGISIQLLIGAKRTRESREDLTSKRIAVDAADDDNSLKFIVDGVDYTEPEELAKCFFSWVLDRNIDGALLRQ
jgi:hypothetical protein